MASTISAGTTSGTAIAITGDTTGALALLTNNGTTAVTIDTSQNVGVGTASPANKLHVYTTATATPLTIETNGSACYLNFRSTSSSTGFIGYGEGGTANMNFYTANTERMRIDSSGKVLIGATSTSSGSRLAIVSSTSGVDTNTSAITSTSGTRFHWSFQDGSSSTERGSITTNGSATAYNTSSDYRLKENVVPMTGALDKVTLLKPVTYKWKSNGSNGEGFIAHELAEVMPDCVVGEKDAMRTEQYEISAAIPATIDEEGNELTPAVEAVMGEREVPAYQGVDTSFLVATLTAAIQEQQAMITALQADVQALKATPLPAENT